MKVEYNNKTIEIELIYILSIAIIFGIGTYYNITILSFIGFLLVYMYGLYKGKKEENKKWRDIK